MRDHLFISYATEDFELAEWLTLKLTAEGYKVWCDRVKLLGGESYPSDIDEAIKDKTYRMIALLSKNSINKPNPKKERTLALNLMREREEEFLLPLNIDGLKPTEIDWMQSDITFISFHKNWATGFALLLKKLEAINSPKAQSDGKSIAARYFLREETIKNEEEILYSNCLQLEKLPKHLRKYKFDKYIPTGEVVAMARSWAFYKKDGRSVYSFHEPGRFLQPITHVEDIEWREYPTIDGIDTRNVICNLIKKSLDVHLYSKGLQRELRTDERGKKRNGRFYFPFRMLKKDQLHFTDYKGKKNYILACSTRNTKRPDGTMRRYMYHLAPNFIVRRNVIEDLLIIPRIQLYLTDEKGEPLLKRSYLSKRKVVCKFWYNHQWLIRILAIMQYLSDDKQKIVIGTNEDEQIIIDAKPMQFTAPLSISLKEPEETDDVTGDVEISLEDEYEEEADDETS